MVVGGFAVTRIDTIYPKVSMDGENLGGMSLSEAEEFLGESDSFSEYNDAAVTINLPADCALVITSYDAGISTGAEGAARAAYEYGRDGTILANLFSYIRCAMFGAKLDSESSFSIDEEHVRELISEAANEARVKLVDSDAEVGEDGITLVKGAGSAKIDEDELYDIVVTAFREKNYDAIDYVAETTGEDIDIQELYDSIYKEPVDAKYDSETGTITQSEDGVSFDLEEALRLWDEAEVGDTVVIPLIITKPEVTTDSLSDGLFSDCLAQKSTTLSGSTSARINNITKACASINGIVLNPGEEFSYNNTLGQRTEAAGYQAAGAYSNGKVVSEVGGGICQVSSTLYYCTLYSNLKITARTCHYFSVSYLPSGLDAAVSWGSPDFKFVNNRDYPIKIEAYTDMNSYTATVKIWGTDVDGSYVEMTTETWATSTGTGATSYRWVYDKNGNLISKTKEADSEYHYHTDDDDEDEASPSPSAEPSASPSAEPSTSPTATPTDTPAATEPVQTPTPTNPPETTQPVVVVTDPPTQPASEEDYD